MKNLIKSFSYALSGLRQAIFVERNFTIHVFAAFLAIAFCIFLQVSALELTIVMICIATVISTEMIHSAIEKLCDFVHPARHEKIKMIKDKTAAALLVAAMAAFTVGMIIFVPKLVEIF